MATKYLTEPVIWDSYSDDSLFSELGIPREPIIDKRDGKYRVRVFDGVTPGGNPIAGGLLSGVYKPSIVSPADTVTGIAFSPILTASAYGAVNITADPHGSTRWQVASNSLFTNIIFDSNTDTVNLEMIDLSNESIVLDPETTYYVRVKYTSTTDKESEWSAISSFTTVKDIIDGVTFTRITSPQPTAQEYFGRYMVMSGNGLRMAIWSYDPLAGASIYVIRVYSYINGEWTFVNKISPKLEVGIGSSNTDMTFDNNGDILYIGQAQGPAATGGSRPGYVNVYKPTNGVWGLDYKIYASNPMDDAYFGTTVAVSEDDTTLVIGAGRRNNGASTIVGMVYVYKRNQSTGAWDEVQQLLPATIRKNTYYGHSGLYVSADGSVIATNGYANSVDIYVYNGTTYALAKTLNYAAKQSFGSNIRGSSNGDTLAISAHRDTTAGSNKGSVYIFNRSGNDWIESAVIYPPVGFSLYFGARIQFTKNGKTLFVSSDQQSAGGRVCIYTETGGTWNLINTILDDGTNGPYATFGEDIAIDGDGTKLALGSWGSNYITGSNYTGCVYLYE